MFTALLSYELRDALSWELHHELSAPKHREDLVPDLEAIGRHHLSRGDTRVASKCIDHRAETPVDAHRRRRVELSRHLILLWLPTITCRWMRVLPRAERAQPEPTRKSMWSK